MTPPDRFPARAAAALVLLVLALGAPLAARPRPQELPPAPQEDTKPIVRAVRVEGLENLSESAVLGVLGITVGEPYDIRPGSHDAEVRNAWSTYRLVVKGIDAMSVEDGTELVVRVVELPVDFEPRFVGNSKIGDKTLREWGGLTERAELYLHEADGVKRRLLTGYRKKGYHFAEVDVVTRGGEGAPEDEGPPDVIFEIREGPKVRCTQVVVRGNDSLPDTGWGPWKGGLRSLAKVETKGKGLFSWWGKVFVEEALQADLVAMRQVYRDRGWLDAKVEIEELEFNAARSRVRVHVIVDEGPQYTVQSVAVRAVERPAPGSDEEPKPTDLVFPEKALLPLLELKPGVPFERLRMVRDHRTLRDYFGERGYLERRHFENSDQADGWEFLDPEIVDDFESKQVRVTYRVHQGRPRYIREVAISGNEHTRDRVVRREISVLPGQLADVREIEASLRRIVDTGYFSDERDLQHREPNYVFRETGDPDQVDLEYLVQEGRVVDLQLSGGVASDSGLVGLISLTMRNFDATRLPSGFWSTFGEVYRKEAFHGNGELLSIDLSPGSEINFWRFRYSHPDLFGTHFDRWSLDAELIRRLRRFSSHDEDRQRFELTLGRLFGHNFSIGFGPVYQVVDLDNFDDSVPTILNPDSAGETTFHGFEFNMRYDKLDYRLAPSDGHSIRWRNTLYGGVLGGDQDVVQSELYLDWYQPFGDEGDVRPGLYVGLAGGVAQPYDDTDFVNYSERYFLGGSATLRGFDFRGVGPMGLDTNGNQTDFPIGGQTYARGTFEYRFPLYTVALPGTSRRREIFRGMLFSDWGLTDPESFALDPEELRASFGFGFGLTQPVPLTFNFGWPLRDQDGDDLEVFSFRLSLR